MPEVSDFTAITVSANDTPLTFDQTYQYGAWILGKHDNPGLVHFRRTVGCLPSNAPPMPNAPAPGSVSEFYTLLPADTTPGRTIYLSPSYGTNVVYVIPLRELVINLASLHSITFDHTAASPLPYGDAHAVAKGEGRDWYFGPAVEPEDSTDRDDWCVRFTGFGLAAPLVFKHGDATYPLEVDEEEWTFRALVTPTHTDDFVAGSWGTVDLVFQPGGDDEAIFRRTLGRAVA